MTEFLQVKRFTLKYISHHYVFIIVCCVSNNYTYFDVLTNILKHM